MAAIDSGNNQAAWALLSREAQQKINQADFLAVNRDYQVLIELFGRAGITTKAKSREDILGYNVKNRSGELGEARFTTVEEMKVWRIANISPWP